MSTPLNVFIVAFAFVTLFCCVIIITRFMCAPSSSSSSSASSALLDTKNDMRVSTRSLRAAEHVIEISDTMRREEEAEGDDLHLFAVSASYLLPPVLLIHEKYPFLLNEDDDGAARTCYVCFDSPACNEGCHRSLECGHTGLCSMCFERIRSQPYPRCPLCRTVML
jgi:hypothetical protein